MHDAGSHQATEKRGADRVPQRASRISCATSAGVSCLVLVGVQQGVAASLLSPQSDSYVFCAQQDKLPRE